MTRKCISNRWCFLLAWAFLEGRGGSEEKKNAFVCQAFLPLFSPYFFVLISPHLLIRPEAQISVCVCVCGFLFLGNLAYKPRVKLIHSCQLLFVNINIQGACHDCLFWSVCFVKEREINEIKTTRLSFLADSFTLP